MSTIPPVLTELPTNHYGYRAWQVQWAQIPNGSTGVPVDLIEYTDRSVQVEGTFGTGGSVAIEGSNDGINWEQLRDPSSTLLAITTAGLHGILEMTWQIRPHVTAGDGTTSLTVTLFVRRTFTR